MGRGPSTGMVLPPIQKASTPKIGMDDDDLGEITVVEPQKLKKINKPRSAPANSENMIDKLSAQMGVDQKFWKDFEKSVLSELRSTVEEVDPIEWLMSIAESESGFGTPTKAQPKKPSGDEWGDVEAVLNTLTEIDKMT